jgi:hypothetical protein
VSTGKRQRSLTLVFMLWEINQVACGHKDATSYMRIIPSFLPEVHMDLIDSIECPYTQENVQPRSEL